MANFILKNKIEIPKHLKEFNDFGYSYNNDISENNKLVFIRDN
jgi:cytoplasmic iron level regulating protein YaaA (DUF328/UPF0246 family)